MKKHLYFVFLLISGFIWSCGSDTQKKEEIDSTKIEKTTNVAAPSGNRTFQLGKVKGYRIQVHTTLKREEALQYKAVFQNHFPDVPSYLVYEEPIYKVRIGDYLSKTEAKDFAVYVNKVKELYGSFVVKCMVNAIIKPTIKDSTTNIVTVDSIQQIDWKDSTGKTLGAPTEEIMTKEDIAAERKMQQEDKQETVKTNPVSKEEKVEVPKVERNIKLRATTPKDSARKK